MSLEEVMTSFGQSQQEDDVKIYASSSDFLGRLLQLIVERSETPIGTYWDEVNQVQMSLVFLYQDGPKEAEATVPYVEYSLVLYGSDIDARKKNDYPTAGPAPIKTYRLLVEPGYTMYDLQAPAGTNPYTAVTARDLAVCGMINDKLRHDQCWKGLQQIRCGLYGDADEFYGSWYDEANKAMPLS